MPPILARLRVALARLVDATAPAPGGTTYDTVALTVRAFTADAADLRLLMEVRVEGSTLDPHDRERFVHAVTVPSARRWIERHDLAGLQAQLAAGLDEIARTIQEPLAEMGLTLLGVELVAAEHLLSRPPTEVVDGSW